MEIRLILSLLCHVSLYVVIGFSNLTALHSMTKEFLP